MNPFTPLSVKLRYRVTPLGEVPAGYRFDMTFDPGSSTLDDSRSAKGKFLSGSDQALFRSDGVVELLGQGTIAMKEADDPDGTLIDLTYTGVIDLTREGKDEEAYEKWLREGVSQSCKATLFMKFNVAGPAPTWAPETMRKRGARYDKYRNLARALFVARGDAKFLRERMGALDRLDLTAWDAAAFVGPDHPSNLGQQQAPARGGRKAVQ